MYVSILQNAPTYPKGEPRENMAGQPFHFWPNSQAHKMNIFWWDLKGLAAFSLFLYILGETC